MLPITETEAWTHLNAVEDIANAMNRAWHEADESGDEGWRDHPLFTLLDEAEHAAYDLSALLRKIARCVSEGDD